MSNLVIEINSLNKNYKNILAVNNLNFKINKGEIIGLLGPNGSGKSTTIGMMLGLIKPTSGNVLIDGQDIENNRTEILKRMNFISPYIELPKKLTVEENLEVYGRMYGVKNLKDNDGIVCVTKPSVIDHLGCISSGHRKSKKDNMVYDKALDFYRFEEGELLHQALP